MLNVDLHCHSTISDGLLAPALLAARAKSNGVEAWALTDHDEINGIAEARQAAAELDLPFIPGVEISATWAGHTIHVVGLQIDETNAALLDGLAVTRSGRQRRALDIAAQLAAAGVPDAYEGALKFVGNPDLISRMHFARHIAGLGMFSTPGEVFKHFLIEGKPGYVPHRWATLEESLNWIHGAGGVAVIAHPGRYKVSELALGELFDEFKQRGGEAIEVTTGSHTVDQYEQFASVARRYGFLGSRGSDFHGPGESRADLGQLPELPAGVQPVWHNWNF